jgi:starch phosphorylase
MFSANEPGLFDPLLRGLLDDGDPYFHLADFDAYVSVRTQIADTFAQSDSWSSKAILNVSRMSKFSSDRTIREYARDIWNVTSVTPAVEK